jgi:hypothetical protein
MKTIYATPIALLVMQLAACGQDAKNTPSGTDTSGTSGTVAGIGAGSATDESTPQDSTGATGNVGLALTASSASAAALADAGIELTLAKLNVAMVKLKPAKAPTTKDADIAAAEKSDEATEDAAVAAATGDGETDGAALAAGDKAAEQGSGDRAAKLAAKKDDLKERDHAHNDREKGRDKAIRFAGPFVFDVLTGKLEGQGGASVAVPDGSYRRLEFKVRRTFDVVETDPLFGNAAVIQGTFSKDGAAVPFTVEIHSAMNFRLTGDQAMAVSPAADNSLGLHFDAAAWMAGIDLAGATVGTDGSVQIDQAHNQALLKQIRANIQLATHFGKDADGDGKVSDAETAGKGEAVAD